MAIASRRLASVVLGTVCALVSGVAGQAGSASASAAAAVVDPITNQAAPTLKAPANDPTGVSPLKDVVLKWSAVPRATRYEVQISPNGDWTNNKVDLPDNGKTVNTTYEVALSLPHAFYYWRVRGTHGTAHTAWSKEREFLREWYAPFSMLHTPSAADPTVTWEPVPQASVYLVRFATKSDFSDALECFTAQTSFTPYLLVSDQPERVGGGCFDASQMTQSTRYFWQVVAYDDSTAKEIVADTGNDSSFLCDKVAPECDAYRPNETSAAPSFVFDAPHAGALDPDAVVTGRTTTWHTDAPAALDCVTTMCPTTPTFSWDPVAGANYYRVHIWRDPYRTNTYRVYETSFPTLTPRDNFFDAQAGTPYYWSVAPATCRNSTNDDFCAVPADAAATGNPVCADPADSATAPTVSGLSVNPAGPNGAQSMPAGGTGTVTLTGTNFADDVCVTADSGRITNITKVSGTSLTFHYTAPESAGSDPLKFTVINPDGGNAVSPPLEIVGAFDKVQLGFLTLPLASFEKRSDNVNLTSPANGSSVHEQSVTFSWSDFMASGGQGSLDARNYHLQVSSDADFDTVRWDVDDIDMTQFTNSKALLPDGVWFWRVQPIDQSGNPLTWSKTGKFTKESTPPQLRLVKDGAKLTIRSTEPARGVRTDSVRLEADHGLPSVHGKVTKLSSMSWRFIPATPFVVGESYQLTVDDSVKDEAGNSAIVIGPSVVLSNKADDRSDAWSFNGKWAQHTSSQAVAGTYSTGRKGNSATVRIVGSTVKVVACTGPDFGKLQVVIDGSPKTTVSEHHSFTKCGVTVWKGDVNDSTDHTVKLVAKSGTASFDAVEVG